MSKWIEWNGGDMPVPEGANIEVMYRGATKLKCKAGKTGAVRWNHTGANLDIVAYRLLDDCAGEEGKNPRAFGTSGQDDDHVNHPKHYTSHPSGIECIQVTEHMGFNLGNAVKYIWRADLKGNALEDLLKARWYIDREIQKREKGNNHA